MREGFGFFTVSARGSGVGPTGFDGVDGKYVQACFVDKPPVAKTEVEAGVVPTGAIAVVVCGKATGNFALVW